MDIARALRFAGYPLVFAVGEPLWIKPFSSDQHLVDGARIPAWAVAYAVFAIAFHLSADAPESMIKLGESMIAMGQKKEGCIALAALRSKYPTAPKSLFAKASATGNPT